MSSSSDNIVYDPSPISWLPGDLEGAGQFRLRASDVVSFGEIEQRTIAAIRTFARDPRTAAERRSIRTLVIHTSVKCHDGFDVRWLTGFDALERLVVVTNAGGIRGANGLAALPALREATLCAYDDNRIHDVDGLAQSRSLETLRLWWGGLSDLRALRGLASLRSLSIHENRPFSLHGIESSGIEDLDLWLPAAPCDLGAVGSLSSLRTLRIRGVTSRDALHSLVRTSREPLERIDIAAATDDSAAVLDALSALPAAREVQLQLYDLIETSPLLASLPITQLRLAAIDANGVRVLSRAPRLNTLRIGVLRAADLAPLADLPALRTISLRRMPGIRHLDALPACAFESPARAPPGPARLVLAGTRIESVDALHRLRGVDHIDFRHCRSLRSVQGLRAMPDVKSVDLRGTPRGLDLGVLETIATLRAVLFNHLDRGNETIPPALRPLVRRADLRGLVRRGV